MEKVDRAEYEKRLKRISDIFSDMVVHADEQALTRCPYKNKFDQCTAQFGCRNKRKPRGEGELPACVSDDLLDYRNAWETEPAESYEEMRETLKKTASASRDEKAEASGSVKCDGKECPAEEGKTIFDHADVLEIKVPTSCFRSGQCHECIVEIRHGMDALSPRTETEAFLRDNYRLSCQSIIEKPEQEVEFSLLRRLPKILTSPPSRETDLDPVVTRKGESVFYDGEEIDKYRGHIYGIALDVGTTTVVMETVDLETGQSAWVSSFENPQRFGGSDVMNRISYDSSEFHGELHRAIVNIVNEELEEMCVQLDITRHEIYEILVVGNSTMRDMFFNLDVQSIGEKPYKSLIEKEFLNGERQTTSITNLARKLRLKANKNARAFGVPLIASHVGADVVADLVSIDMESQTDLVMLADVGTNTEVVIGNRDRLIAASCPAGPAFEGGLITFGMPGCEGAIETIRYDDGRFEFTTIGESEPRGICGSGLIDLLAELRRNDLMTPKGVFAKKVNDFTIDAEHGITFSREDASQLAQAKAANYCGQMILMRKFGVTPDQISKLYLAGGFANYVNSESAVEIGFIAPVPTDRIVKAGNAAAQGARELLLSKRKRESIERLIKTVEHVELETMPDFFEVFVDGCQFKPMEFVGGEG